MKYVAVFLISFYQVLIAPVFNLVLGTSRMCRYEETCSHYAKRVILEKGALKGALLALVRLSSCHPFGTIRE